ncbi:NAD(P)H-dependent oxidoreductase [Gordonia zhaorongruii]|uniref:NAD(P)H-dependent oxidoreductase n=1 Tax=Gordonia zhaorongruii TaxID=2597659 RepID=UPI00104D686A|nr:NAD(P)H-dependent oxidoreductase [Gordonia zhaorongruii]
MPDRRLRIAVLVGSLRADSVNRQLAEVAVESIPDGVEASIIEGLGELAFYNEDVDNDESLPAGIAEFRRAAGDADAFLVVTPEYNGTMPAVLKNAVDWLSRPFGAGAVSGKPVGVVGSALGRYAGVWSREDTRRCVGIAGGRVIEDVEIGLKSGELGEEGVRSPEIVEQVTRAVRVLADSVAVAV